MLQGLRILPNGLSVRPARQGDQLFFQKLFRSTREDLQALNLPRDAIEQLLDMQETARNEGYGNAFPSAFEFVLEKAGDRVGRLLLSWGGNEARVVDLSFIPALRNQGLGTAVIAALQQAAGTAKLPLAVTVLRNNTSLKAALTLLGFVTDEGDVAAERMVWYPTRLEMGG